MPNTPTPTPAPPSKALLHTLSLACAVFLIPVLIGVLFVLASHRFMPQADGPSETVLALVTNRLHDGSATNAAQLAVLRRDLRNEGLPTEEIDLRLWAARAAEPECLFRVPPPDPDKRWNWHIAQDGRHALAVSIQFDASERRTVGLYDFVDETWVWTHALPWPDAHESPYVFDRHVVVRYVKNTVRFALELDDKGQIISIDKLGAGAFAMPTAISADPLFPGSPVALKNNVFFTADPTDSALLGYAHQPLPGLRYAGPGDANTTFSGNGQLKFTAAQGRVTVADSLTQTVLQRFNAWPNATNTTVTATLASHDGANFTVFLQTVFDGAPPVKREWSVAIDLYAGTVKQSVNAAARFAKPVRTVSQHALTADGRWRFDISDANDLRVSPASDPGRAVARVALAPLGLRAPIRSLAFLENGRHLVLRQDADVWLLDVATARAYGGLTARVANADRTISLETYRVKRETGPEDKTGAQLALSPQGYGLAELFDSDTSFSFMPDPDATAPAYQALRAERFASNQAWGYAADLLSDTARLQAFDPRAPRVNPLLLARCQILSGQRQAARATCRDALRTLIADRSAENRMIRYLLQGLLFATPPK
jgi:hypothetical protein